MTFVSKNPAFLNRELSWLEFDSRVLHEAEDERTPLLERLKFIAIFASNLDEFYMVRVAGLRRQLSAGVQQAPPDGLMPAEQLALIDERVRALVERCRHCLHDVLLPELREIGVRVLGVHELEPDERATLDAYFEGQVYPVLTPLAVDPGASLPLHLESLALTRGGVARPGARRRALRAGKGAEEPAALGTDRPTKLVRAARGPHRGAPRRALPRDGDPGEPSLPPDALLGPRDL